MAERAGQGGAAAETAQAGAGAAGYVLGLSGLRGAAALAILVAHVIDYGAPGDAPGLGSFEVVRQLLGLSVVLFFTLSGFLLYRRFAAAIVGVGRPPDLRDYALARVLRIVPAYWAILLVVGVLFSAALVRGDDGRLTLGNLLTSPGALVGDALLIQNDIPATTITGIGPAWTLAIEVVFYVVLPLLALPLLVLATRRRTLGPRVALALVAPLALLAVGLTAKASVLLVPSLAGEGWSDDWSGVLHRSFAYNADLFAPGMAAGVAAVLLGSGTLVVRPGARRATLVAAVAVVAAATVAHAAEVVPSTTFETLAAIGFALLMLSLATGERSRIVIPLESRALVFVGLVSYSVFLWHEPVTRWLAAHGATLGGAAGIPVNVAIVLAVVLPLSYASYRLVEAPALRLRGRRALRRAAGGDAPAPS